jgi:hypothetical protein
VRSRRRRGVPAAVQEALFEVQLRPERRYYRQILQAFSGFAFDPLRAEVAAAKVLGVIWASDAGRDGTAEETFGLGLVDYARQTPSPTAVALLRALASVGTVREVREAASQAADRLVGSGLPALTWPTLFRGRCWAHEDDFGDLTTMVCEFGYGPTWPTSEKHAIVVQVDHVAFSAATSVEVIDDVAGNLQQLQYAPSRALHSLRQVEPGFAGALLERALARTDLIPTVDVLPSFAETRALALARVRSLPSSSDLLPLSPSPERRSSVVVEFVSSPEAPPGSEPVVRLIAEFAALRDPGDLLRVSPGRWEAFLFDFLPSSVSSASPILVAAVVRAWSGWASGQIGLTLAAREELARQLDEMLVEFHA